MLDQKSKLETEAIRMIDPPEGWRHGFPKECDAPEGMRIEDWLEENGYPRELIDQFPDGVPYRMWMEEPGC